jgi:hypothetical protein
MVAPSANILGEAPTLSSTYLSPNSDRGRIVAVESTGTLAWL